MIKRFLCYVSEFFYHTLTPSRTHYTYNPYYYTTAAHFYGTLQESVRRRRIGQSADRVRGAAVSAPPTPAEDSGGPSLSLTLSRSLPNSSSLDFAIRSRRSHRYTVNGFPNRRTSGKTVAFTAVVAEIGQYNLYNLYNLLYYHLGIVRIIVIYT